MYYRIKGEYYPITGTGLAARTREIAEEYIRKFKERVNPDAKCEIIECEGEPHFLDIMVLY